MTRVDLETDSSAEYFARLGKRLTAPEAAAHRLLQLKAIAASADRHFERMTLPRRRYLRAVTLGDKIAQKYEQETILTLMYEVADTVFIVLNSFDLDQFDVRVSMDGQGIWGEDAGEVVQLADSLNRYCRRILEIEREFDIRADFKRPVDEREGETYTHHKHWQDFVHGSIQRSFNHYFSDARAALHRRLAQRPKIWKDCTLREHLQRRNYRALLEIASRLEHASLVRYEVVHTAERYMQEYLKELNAASSSARHHVTH